LVFVEVGMSLEDEIVQSLADKISKKIDQEILDDITMKVLIEDGWVETKVNPAYTDMGMLSGKYEEWYSKTAEWIHLNAQGDYRLIKGQWLFKDPRDATMFLLRWA
jgi:hypothetical protein